MRNILNHGDFKKMSKNYIDIKITKACLLQLWGPSFVGFIFLLYKYHNPKSG